MHWIVDAMNVIGTRPDGWWRDRDAAMARLVDRLERFVAETGDDVTVVFERKPRPPIRSTLVEIAHARKGGPDAADYEIVKIVEAHAAPRDAAGGDLRQLALRPGQRGRGRASSPRPRSATGSTENLGAVLAGRRPAAPLPLQLEARARPRSGRGTPGGAA